MVRGIEHSQLPFHNDYLQGDEQNRLLLLHPDGQSGITWQNPVRYLLHFIAESASNRNIPEVEVNHYVLQYAKQILHFNLCN